MNQARRFLPLALAAAVGAAAGLTAYKLSSHGSTAPVTRVVAPTQQASSTTTITSLASIYQQDAPGVVDITVTSTPPSSNPSGGFNPFGIPQPPQQQKQQAEGTGFVIDTKGDILTAEHVVDNASSIKVTFQDGSTANATLIGTDKSTDTGVIHVGVSASKLHPLTLGNSSAVQPGQQVVAIGSPFGLSETMTEGIVSAINRSITAPNNFSIAGTIQTDAAINHGNSGGPLIDVATNTVVGINDQILNAGDTNDNAGVGFAVPINNAKGVARTLIAGGTVKHAYMGVEIRSHAGGGASVGKVVAGSPAAKAGLKVGDVITAFGGKTVLNADTLTADVTSSHPGDKVTLTVTRKGATKHLTLRLGTQPKSAS